MYNLIRFIQKHHFVILFILLEVICIVLLSRSQNYHKQVVFNTTNDAVGKVYEWGNDIGNYFHLKRTNQQLAEENAMLRQQLSVVTDTTTSTYDIQGRDTIYEYIPARIVNNSITNVNNYMIIDKGRVDGIEEDMCVISSDGIVGVVADVSTHYATIISLLHTSSAIGVRFLNNQELGTLKWGTNNYRYGMVEDIPTHIVLQPGDTVVTGPYSLIFPEDLMVGTVEELLQSPTGDLNHARIKFATNFATLRQVYVVRNLYKNELDELKSNFKEE